MSLSDSPRNSSHPDVSTSHDHGDTGRGHAAEGLSSAGEHKNSQDVKNERDYWSSKAGQGADKHLQNMTIDFGDSHAVHGNGQHGGNESNSITREKSRTKDKDGNSTETLKDDLGTTTDKFDARGTHTASDRQNKDGSSLGWKLNADKSTTIYSSPDKDHRSETTITDKGIASEKKTTNTPDGKIESEKKYGDKGSYVENGTGPKPENNYTKSDDGKGNIISHSQDGSGYSRATETNGSFSESHYGPKKEDNYSVKGDGKGNNVETRQGENGTHTEKHTFPDSNRNYSAEVQPDGKGGFTEKRSYADKEKDVTINHRPDGQGGYSEKYRYDDSSKNYSKEVGADGKTTYRDSVGLKAEVYGASPDFADKAFGEVRKLPESDRKLLAETGNKFAIAGKMSDIDPKLATEQPRGWPEGKTFNDADGVYMSGTKQIAVAENTNAGPSDRTEGVVRHEAGHGIDNALKDFSHSAEFQKAYDKDVSNLTASQKKADSYLLQDHQAGPEETAADVYGALNGASSNPSETAKTLREFPNVADAIKKRLDENR